MDRDRCTDAQVIESWTADARPWIRAVREGRIESRCRVTDAAIVDAVSEQAPDTVLDIGCGEGWLARALAAEGIQVVGIDAVPALVAAARGAGVGEFHVLDYQALTAGCFDRRFDAAVCNFSLLGKDSVEAVLAAVPSLLQPAGALLIQTLHPLEVCGDLPYRDGWRQASRAHWGSAQPQPAPWYFRTLEGWQALLEGTGFGPPEVREAIHPDTRRPASVIFIARLQPA